MLVNQPPAKHAAYLARMALLRMVGVVCIWAGLTLAARTATPFSTHRPLLISYAVVAILGAVVFSNARMHRAKALVGARSERRVARVLKSLGPVALLNSTLLGAGGDADHIVLGPWLVVVETKTGRGQTRYSGNQLFIGSRAIPGNPVSQVRRQAQALRGVAQEYTDAIVCVVDQTNPPYQVGDTTVCSLTDLPRVLRALPSRLSDARATDLFTRLGDLHASPAPTTRPSSNRAPMPQVHPHKPTE
jgi:hypothetical protein